MERGLRFGCPLSQEVEGRHDLFRWFGDLQVALSSNWDSNPIEFPSRLEIVQC